MVNRKASCRMQTGVLQAQRWPVSSVGKELASQMSSPVVPLSKEPSTQLMGQCCYRWPKKLRLHFVQLRAVSRCCIVFHASALLCLVCYDSCVVIARAFKQ